MIEPIRILTTEIQPWRSFQARAEEDLGFPLEFIEKDFNSAQRTAAFAPESFDVYDQCFHNLDIVWYWRAVQAIDTKRIEKWDALDDLSRILPEKGTCAAGDVPASRLYVQRDKTLSDVPSRYISMLPTFYNFDSFGVETTGLDVDQDIGSWAALVDPRWAGQVALVDEPAIGLFDLAMALSAAGRIQFKDMGNMTVAEIDRLIDEAKALVARGHLRPFWLRADEPVERFQNGELKLASIWSPTIVEMRRKGIRARQAHPKEGYRAWHGGMCLSRHLAGRRLDQAYEWLNWYLGGYAGAVVAKQGYYMSASGPVKEQLPAEYWDYWYEGLPARQDLTDVEGRVAIKAGHIRAGGSWKARGRNIAIWNTTMDEHNYVVRRWKELVALAAQKHRVQRRVS
jgi:putative spermidine/putrescine transport system substrate-binding protein